MATTKDQKWSSPYRYRLPGFWRRWELWEELNRRLGLGYTPKQFENWFYYLQRLGLIPQGAERVPIKGSSGGVAQMWTDRQLEEIVMDLKELMNPKRLPKEERERELGLPRRYRIVSDQSKKGPRGRNG